MYDIDPMDIDPDTGRPYSNYSSPSLDTDFHDGEMDDDDGDEVDAPAFGRGGMSGRGCFNTSLLWHDSAGNEVEADVRVVYSWVKGYPDTHEEPGCPDEIEIISITPNLSEHIIPDYFETSEELLAECAQDLIEFEIEAAEWRAESRRGALLSGGVA